MHSSRPGRSGKMKCQIVQEPCTKIIIKTLKNIDDSFNERCLIVNIVSCTYLYFSSVVQHLRAGKRNLFNVIRDL